MPVPQLFKTERVFADCQDAPAEYEGAEILKAAKPCGRQCLTCIHTARGSFKKETIPDLGRKKKESQPLSDKPLPQLPET
jgi:hypothetical protein